MAEESQPPLPRLESRAVSLPDGQYLVERLVAKRKRKVWTIYRYLDRYSISALFGEGGGS